MRKPFLENYYPWLNRWLFQSVDTFGIQLFRIVLGALLISYFLMILPSWNNFFASNGFLSLDEVLRPGRFSRWSLFELTRDILPVLTYWLIGFLSAVGLLIGKWVRFSSIALFAIFCSMARTNSSMINGEDLVFRMFLFYMCFAPPMKGGLEFVVRNESFAEGWRQRLLKLNFCAIYYISVPYKLLDDVAWRNGEAFYWAIHNDQWTRLPDWLVTSLFSYTQFHLPLLTYGVLIVEGILPILIWFEKTRRTCVAVLVLFHIFVVFIFANVTFFNLAMVVGAMLFVRREDFAQSRGQLLACECFESGQFSLRASKKEL